MALTRLRQSHFAKNVMIVASGTALAQAINMAFIPVITRLYGPEAYGLLGVFMAILGVVAPVAALTYPVAIVLSEISDEAKGIARLAVLIAVLLAAGVALILLVGDDHLLRWIGAEELGGLIYFLPVAMLCAGFVQIYQQWLIRNKQFVVNAQAMTLQSLLTNFVKAIGGVVAPFAGLLIAATAIGQLIFALLLGYGARRTGVSPWQSMPGNTGSFRSIRGLAQKYRHFPLFRAPQAFINPLSHSVAVILLSAFSGAATAGFFTLARTVMAVPSSLLGSAVGNVLYPKLVEAFNSRERVFPIIAKATVVLAAVGILPFGIVVLWGEELFRFVFGGEWGQAGIIAQWLTLWLFVGFINVPSVQAMPVLALLPFFLVYEIVGTVLKIAALFIGFYFFNQDIVAVALYSVVGAFLNASLIVVVFIHAQRRDKCNIERNNSQAIEKPR